VLVVDDNATNRRILCEILRSWEMCPVEAEDGFTALALIEQAAAKGQPFPLILLDASMPDMNGFTLAEEIRKRKDWGGTVIMMLTSVGRRGDVARCRKLGIAAYLTKPLKPSDLLDALAMVLHAAEQGESPAPLVTRHSLREARRRLRILLAEDNAINQKLAVRLLEKQGHEVVVAQNGREAVEIWQREEVDLILMDVQMPEMDGLEATRWIRERERETGKHTPIIAMTAHAMKGDRERCLEAGMDGYLSKPIRPRELEETIQAMVASHPSQEVQVHGQDVRPNGVELEGSL
jgi:CheY-like chemotaxis protein